MTVSLLGCGVIGLDRLSLDTETNTRRATGTDSSPSTDTAPATDGDSDPAGDTGSGELSMDTESETVFDSMSDTDPDPDDTETGSPWDGDSDVETGTPTEAIADTTTGSTDTDADTDMDTDADTDTDAGRDSDTDLDTFTDMDTDTNTGCSPGPEVCDGVDNDCNLAVDDTPAMTPLCSGDAVCLDGACISLPAQNDCVGYQFSTHAYALCSEMVDWDVARARCEQMGAHLATIGSEEEDVAVKTLAPGKQVDAWIGLRRWAACEWEWVTLEPIAFTAWPPNYPDGACGIYDCCQLWSKENAQWDDTYCTDLQPYLCEWEPS